MGNKRNENFCPQKFIYPLYEKLREYPLRKRLKQHISQTKSKAQMNSLSFFVKKGF